MKILRSFLWTSAGALALSYARTWLEEREQKKHQTSGIDTFGEDHPVVEVPARGDTVHNVGPTQA